MRPLIHHTAAALTLMLAGLLGCAAEHAGGGGTPHPHPDPVNEPVVDPAPVVMHPVEPSPMPEWAQWMPAPDFPGVERGGSFAHDVGMMWDGVRVGGKYYRQDAMAPVVLAAAGWATATMEERKQIAERYCRGLLDWDIVWNLEHEPWEASRAGEWSPAEAVVRDGAIVFTAWSDETFVGMRPPQATAYRRFEAVFQLDGRVTVRVLASYDAPRHRS